MDGYKTNNYVVSLVVSVSFVWQAHPVPSIFPKPKSIHYIHAAASTVASASSISMDISMDVLFLFLFLLCFRDA
jgi:hypothetical protein